MPSFFNVDHKIIAASALTAATSVTLYSCYKWWQLHKVLQSRDERDNVYETARYLNEYLQFHYGLPNEVLQWDFGPATALEFPKRCAELCIKYAFDKTHRAIDIGCAVGRSTFELARHFDEVIGVDYSKSFVDTCNVLREKGKLGYSVLKQGTITEDHVAIVSQDIERTKAHFIRGDACNLPLDIGQFDCVLAANLIDRLHTPQSFLDRLSSLVAPGGILVITTPYSFMTEFTPRTNWIGGWVTDAGKEHTGFDGLKDHLADRFELVADENMPFLIRETQRKHQWTVAHASVWRRNT